MARYWLKRLPSAPTEGPLTGEQIKRLAAAGHLTSSALLSADNVKWTAASKVKGLFPERVPPPAVAACEPIPLAAPGAADLYDLVEAATPAQPVFATPAPIASQPLAYASNVMPHPRNVQWYMVCASIVLTLGIISRVLDFTYNVGSSFTGTFRSVQRSNAPSGFGLRGAGTAADDEPSLVLLIFSAILAIGIVVGAVGLYIYFTIWAYLAHRDFRQFTLGAYPIGPGRACGFCWIPLFNLFWLVYMPYKLAESVEWHLGPGRPIVTPRNILWMQLGAIIAGCCVAGLPNFLHASTAKQIQTGLNALWLNPMQVPLRRR